MPIQLLKGDESMKIESVASFVQRVTSDWNLARQNLQRSVGLQQKYYDQKHRDFHYNVGDLVLLSTRNLKMQGAPAKLQRRFVGPFKIIEIIGRQAYKLSLPEEWKIHPVLHVPLLKDRELQVNNRTSHLQWILRRSRSHTMRLRRSFIGEK